MRYCNSKCDWKAWGTAVAVVTAAAALTVVCALLAGWKL